LDILFENSDFIIINKPAGLSVHPLRISDTKTLVNGLIAYDKNITNIGEDLLRPGIVHRLDKETSGIMIVAKNNSSFNKLKEMFQNHLVQKTYIALVYGKMKNMQGEINFSITRSKQKFNKRKIDLKKEDGSVEAITIYKVIKEFKNTSLLEAYPKTGRTHQIRVHLAALSNFIIGDKEYGSNKINKEFPLKRQFLHAKRLEFE
jgi:23S rRNA pseudouridine1911/1915/1917 synthase